MHAKINYHASGPVLAMLGSYLIELPSFRAAPNCKP